VKDDRDSPSGAPARGWEPSPWSYSPAAYLLALAVWSVLGMYYVPVLSMILTPLWMVLWVSLVPRWVTRLRRRLAP
jgi:hypothetical protein